ncbi:DUF3696 domain-containing protein [Microbacterium sp.]|uniref:DUF3696 domain-containing protein n=1 Tax=Microbacterium sp. TaxID=51671 RepID=UPI003A91B287
MYKSARGDFPEDAARHIAKRLMDVVRGESLEAAFSAASDAVYDEWARGLPDGRIEASASSSRSHMLRKLGDKSQARITEALRRYDLQSREQFSAVFEELLQIRESALGRAGLSFSSSPAVADLMAGLVGPGAKLLDPACGFGGTLLAAARRAGRELVGGVDVNAEAANFARRRLQLAGLLPQIVTADFIDVETEPIWDAIIVEPPMGSRLSDESLWDATSSGYGRRSRLSTEAQNTDALWLVSVAESLAPHGRGVILTPKNVGSKPGLSANMRDFLLESGRVEAIVAMPPGSVQASSAETSMWVLRGSGDARPADDVLLVNAQALVAHSADDPGGTYGAVLEVAGRWGNIRDISAEVPEWFAKPVPAMQLVASRNANPQRHLDAPPETVAPRPASPGRLLTEVRLKSFKSVDADVRAALKPLTLIYGRNSAGKSSLIQSLLLLKQSALGGRLSANGPLTKLGTVAGLTHNHATDIPIGMGVSFASSPEIDSTRALPNPGAMRSIDLLFSAAVLPEGSLLESSLGIGDAHFRWYGSPEHPDIMVTDLDELEEMVRFAYSEQSLHPTRKAPASDRGRAARNALKRARQATAMFGLTNFVPSHAIGATAGDARQARSAATSDAQLEASLRTVESVFGAVGDEFGALLDRIVYLGPLRQAPERIHVRGAEVGALDLPYFLLDNISERQEVSERLQRLGVPYDLDVVSLSDPAERSLFGEIAALVLTDTRTGTRLSPADVGFGISQVLPIVTELSARTSSTILIEQPEIHLHPAMQADLADLMIESAEEGGRANQIIAETHSESLMLRVQRRIREGRLSPDDVAVLYVDQDAQGSAVVQRLRLDVNGDFLDSWPHGFFAERFDEAFSGLL